MFIQKDIVYSVVVGAVTGIQLAAAATLYVLGYDQAGGWAALAVICGCFTTLRVFRYGWYEVSPDFQIAHKNQYGARDLLWNAMGPAFVSVFCLGFVVVHAINSGITGNWSGWLTVFFAAWCVFWCLVCIYYVWKRFRSLKKYVVMESPNVMVMTGKPASWVEEALLADYENDEEGSTGALDNYSRTDFRDIPLRRRPAVCESKCRTLKECCLFSAGFMVFVVVLLALIGGLWAAAELSASTPGTLVKVNGNQIHLYCVGTAAEGKPVILLESGIGEASESWGGIQHEVARQAETRVCSYDRLGYGRSTQEPTYGLESSVDNVHWLLEASAEHATVESGGLVLVGHHYGAAHALLYAQRYPQNLKGVIMLDPVDPADPEDPFYGSWSKGGLVFLRAAALLGPMRLLRFMADGTFYPTEESLADSPRSKMQKLRALEGWPQVTLEDIGRLSNLQQLNEGHPDIKVAVLVGSNTKDSWRDKVERLSNGLPNSELYTIDGAGHDCLYRHREAVIHHIVEESQRQ